MHIASPAAPISTRLRRFRGRVPRGVGRDGGADTSADGLGATSAAAAPAAFPSGSGPGCSRGTRRSVSHARCRASTRPPSGSGQSNVPYGTAASEPGKSCPAASEPGEPDATASISCPGVGRCPGSLARQAESSEASFASVVAISASTSGLGSSNATRCMTSTPVPSPNGALPVAAKTRVQARENTSEAVSHSPVRRYSGDM